MSVEPRVLDSDDLWRRVGLGELRNALQRVERLTRTFEQALRALPPCNTCARGSLLEQIHTVGSHLDRELVGVTVLANSLKEAVAAAEPTREALAAGAPAPCQCGRGPCTCHE
jgi:hypothetical protein